MRPSTAAPTASPPMNAPTISGNEYVTDPIESVITRVQATW